MKFKKLVKKAENLFPSSKHDEDVKRKSLKKLLKKLREYEKKAQGKLENAPDIETREALEKKIIVARAQRKKGLKLLKKVAK